MNIYSGKEGEEGVKDALEWKNKITGVSPLHCALRNKNLPVAIYLLNHAGRKHVEAEDKW